MASKSTATVFEAPPAVAGRTPPQDPHTAPKPSVSFPVSESRPSRQSEATARPPTTEAPTFDVVRVEPTGEAVVAGQAAPNASVDLLVSGKTVAQASVDGSGHFVILPPALPPGSSALTLRQSGAGPLVASTQSIAVSVPNRKQDPVVVALVEPGLPTRILAAPNVAQAPNQTPSSRAAPGGADDAKILTIRSVELENGEGFFAAGRAAAGTVIRIYLNGSHLTDVVAGADRGWSVKILKGLTSGHYAVRADAMSDTSRVIARVEVPFDVPVRTAGNVPAPQPATQAHEPDQNSVSSGSGKASASAPDAVIEQIQTTVVSSGDNLWDISRARLGGGWRYTRIYAANVGQIRDPNLIFPGQVFVLPTRD